MSLTSSREADKTFFGLALQLYFVIEFPPLGLNVQTRQNASGNTLYTAPDRWRAQRIIG